MSVSALYLLDAKGRPLIYRDYRGDGAGPRAAERFMSKLAELEDGGRLSPVIYDDGVTYVYLLHSNVYLLAVTRDNVNAASVVVFLHRLVDVFKHYFDGLEEESVRDNFVVVYELLDEVRVLRAGLMRWWPLRGGGVPRWGAALFLTSRQHPPP
jgi:AP-1 complex subunit mu